MRMSIATRVTAACTAMLALCVLLVAMGLRVSGEVQAGNERIDLLTHILRGQDREDKVQRELRLALGDATRDAERRLAVPDARWAKLSARLRAFGRSAAAADYHRIGTVAPELRAALADTRAATLAFVPTGLALIDAARRDPAAIKVAMPSFLAGLKRLEAERTQAREAVGSTIEEAIDANVAYSRRHNVRLLAGALLAIASLFAMALWLRLRVVAPIVAIAARLRDFRSGGLEHRNVPGGDRADELGDLARGLSEYHQAVEERRIAQRRADFLAHHDALTGLPNRLLFENRLAHELARSRRTGDRVAVFAIDMDGFKAINDRWGHAGGDDALRRAARLLSDCVRSDDLVARLGGD